MPRCGDEGYEGDEYGAGHLSGCTKLGVIEHTPDPIPPDPEREESEEWVCPLNCNDPSKRPWTMEYLSFVAMEKSIRLYRFLKVTVYGNPYYWSLVKAFVFFGFGMRTFFHLSRAFQEACEKRKKCADMRMKYYGKKNFPSKSRSVSFFE